MADIKFDCPHCKQHIEAPEEILGVTVNCPTCQGAITVSASKPVQSSAPIPAQTKPLISVPPPEKQTKTCSYCGEEILASAQKCKHCGEYLTSALREARRPAAPAPASPQMVRTAKSRGVYIILGLFLGGLFGIHNFYAGRYGAAVAQLLIILILGWFIIGIVINVLWVLIELCTVTTDGNGNPMA